MMDDLASLRQAFAAAQQNVVTTVKLSERSCVDILFKLIEQKRISLIKTMNGTEFLTWTQLEGEIMLALSQAGGRINLANLSCELGVSLDFVEMKVEELLKQQKHQLSVVQGDLIRSSYLQNISEEINENLQECGQLFFAELSERYSLPAEYLREKLAARMQTCIHGSLHQQQLTTKIFDNRILACARGSLLAACIPVALEHVATAFRLDMDAVLQASQKLINDSVVAGRIHNFFFFPTSYSEAQQKKIEDFFNDNLFVPYKAVKETFATNPKEYLIQKFPGGLVLQKYFVGEKLAESFLAHMREALRSDSWTDLSYLFPLSFDKTDMNELMQRLIEEYIRCRDSAQLIDIVLFVSNNFIDSMIEELKPIIEEKAANDADNGLDSIFSTAGYSKAITLDQSHTDEIPQNKKTGTKRGKPKKNKRKESPDIAVNVVETQSLMNEINGILSNDTVSAIIGEKWLEFPEASREMLRELLMRDSLKIYQKAFSDARQPNAIKQKSEFSQKAVQLETRFERMQLEMRSLQAFGISSANTELPSYPLSVYLLNKLSVEILDPLLAFLFHDIKDESVTVTPKNRTHILDSLGEELPQKILRKAYKLIQARSFEGLEDLIVEAFSFARLMAKKIKKKAELSLLHEQKNFWYHRLEKCSVNETQEVFYVALNYYLIQVLGVAPLFPNEMWSLAIVWKLCLTKDAFCTSCSPMLAPLWESLLGIDALVRNSEAASMGNYKGCLNTTKAIAEVEASKILEEMRTNP